MRLRINRLTAKIFIYHNVVILLLALCLYLIVPPRFAGYIKNEKENSLKQLNKMLCPQSASYFHYLKDKNSGSYLLTADIQKDEILSYLQINPDFKGFALIPTEQNMFEREQEQEQEQDQEQEQEKEAFLYNMHITPEVREVMKKEINETHILNEAGMLKLITPVFTEQGVKKIKRGYLLSGFSLTDQEKELKLVKNSILFICGLFVVLGNLWGYIQHRQIVSPLEKSTALIKDVVQGNLTGMVQSKSKDELGSLIQSLNDMVSTWREKVGTIRSIIESSSAASSEIAITASQQEKVTTNQASSINQVATTIEELDTTSTLVCERAEGVEEKSTKLLLVFLEGQKSVNKSIEIFATIQNSVDNIAEYVLNLSDEAQQIGIILKEIGAIVSQTDMLAINAGIRAARVKESGKQFTVIATELRSLANQSQVFADTISSLISQIQTSNKSTVVAMEQGLERVGEGIQLILDAGKIIEAAIINVKETVNAVKEIALSSHQHSLATNQVAQSVVSINAGMKETAISSKHTLKETGNLHKVHDELLQMIKFYTI